MAQECNNLLVAEIVNILVHNEERTRYELEVTGKEILPNCATR